MTINLDQYTNTLNVTDTATNADLNVNAKNSGNVIITPQSTNAVGLVIAAPAGSTSNSGRIFFDSTGGVSAIANIGGNQVSFRTAATIGTSSGSVQALVSHTASAVNYVQVTGSATGGNVAITSQGSDANIGLDITAKGGGFVRTGGWLRVGISSANYLQLASSSTGFGPVISSVGSDTDIPLVLQPKGTGALQAQQTDSTTTGGNARGTNAVDWQTARGSANQVASGPNTVICGGANNFNANFTSGIVSGFGNSIQSAGGFIGSGYSNSMVAGGSTTYSGIVTGSSNVANGFFNFIGTGYSNTGTSATAVTTQSATMNGTTAVTLSGSNANIKVGQLITGTSISNLPFTYVAAISGTSLTLSQAASGSSTSTLSFYTPHGVVVGGGNNQATGSYSFIGGGGDAGTASNRNVASGDWSTVGGGWRNSATSNQYATVAGGATNAASGQGAFIGAGNNNNSTGYSSVVNGGSYNTANSNFASILGGTFGSTRAITGSSVFPACQNPITSTNGVSQAALIILAKQTTDATATVLTSDGAAGGTTNQVIMPNNSAYFFTGEVVAGVTGGGNTKGWTIEGVIKRGSGVGTTALVGSTVTSMYADVGAATWVIALSADTTNGGLAVTFTGQAATTIRTVCQIRTTEMTY